MSTTTQSAETETGYSEEIERMMKLFARTCRVNYRHRKGGALNNALTIANMEDTSVIDVSEGLLVDPASVVCLVFDPGAVPDKYRFDWDRMTRPAVNSYDETYEEIPVTVYEFETDDGDLERTTYTIDYIEEMEEVLGEDLRANPERVLTHDNTYEWPIRVDHEASGTFLALAPRIRDGSTY